MRKGGYFDRELMEKLKKWEKRREIFAIKGPRQSGKTTLLKMFENWLVREKSVDPGRIVFMTMEDLDTREKFETSPKELIKSYIQDKKRYYFLLDEFHYVKDGGRKLKLLYDVFENVKFVITGSSSLELAGETSKYLVGRVFIFHLFPFSFSEFLNTKGRRLLKLYSRRNDVIVDYLKNGTDFSVEKDIFIDELKSPLHEFLRWGSYPEVIKTDDEETKKMIVKNIFNTYVTRDIIDLLEIHKPYKLKKLVSILSDQLGGMVNYNQLAGNCETYYKNIKKFMEILKQTYIIDTVKPYYKNFKTELRKNPKIYFVDNGLRNYAIDNFLPLESRGEIVENFVLRELKAKGFGNIRYWRTRGKAEVDFVIETGRDLVPIEVKHRNFKRPDLSRGFKSYLSSYRPDRALIATKDFWGEREFKGTKVKFVPVCYL